MKNKKGFTLTELLIVIIILVSVAGTTIFGMDKISENIDNRRLEELKKEIELATEVYFSNHPLEEDKLLNGEIEENCTNLYLLQNEGLIDMNLVNPITKNIISSELCVYSRVNDEGVIVHEFNFE